MIEPIFRRSPQKCHRFSQYGSSLKNNLPYMNNSTKSANKFYICEHLRNV